LDLEISKEHAGRRAVVFFAASKRRLLKERRRRFLLTTKTPAEAGARDPYKPLKKLGSGFRRNDKKETLPFFRGSSRQGFYRSFGLQAD
jgi:hypothetical protein